MMNRRATFKLLSLFVIGLVVSKAYAHSPSELLTSTIVDELRAKGFKSIGQCNLSPVSSEKVPFDFQRANPPWWSQQLACRNGGYALERYSGRSYVSLNCATPAKLVSGLRMECGLAVSGFLVDNKIACLYLVADSKCGLAPGIIALNSKDVIKK